MRDTRSLILKSSTDFPPIRRSSLEILQVNLGYLCNMSCVHCHVNAGPTRTELMTKDNIDLVIEVLKTRDIKLLDLTGGAPEMNPHFRELVVAARELGVEVVDRCNLTILEEPGHEDLAEFLAENQVHVTASLPCYSMDRVDAQRGKGTFASSIRALQLLNKLGYGQADGKLKLDLVYNPQGAQLPPPQGPLQADYKQKLQENFDIQFNQLLVVTNMPISRFGAVLLAKKEYDPYMTLLKDNFSTSNLSSLMCRSLVSVDWQGKLYDCDFNQMLDLPLGANIEPINGAAEDQAIEYAPKAEGQVKHLTDLLEDDFKADKVLVAEHCFGCTAGQGSSCSGALT
ncbi:MAG: radical SAM protein [Gammaproteobacteria bacterium]|nr:MAG: radical SAM protein [Gammaproteobacteria bacterium]